MSLEMQLIGFLSLLAVLTIAAVITILVLLNPSPQRRKQLNLAKRVGDINGNKIIDIEDSRGQTPTLYLVYDDRNQYRVANKVIIDILNEYPHLVTED